MNTKIQKIKFNDLSHCIFNPELKRGSDANGELSIARIESMSHHLRIDFVYRASNRYTNGGWISMEPECYVESSDHQFKCILVQADNIPLAPKKHYFSRKGELWSFTLWFTPLPDGIKEINFIEKLNGRTHLRHVQGNNYEESGNYFNFFGIKLEKTNHVRIDVGAN